MNSPGSKLEVWLNSSPEDWSPPVFEAGLDEGIELTFGEDPPESGTYEVLVAGRPDRRMLQSSSRLKALVIPWAGVPSETRELVGEFPNVSVHNLHHNAEATAELAVALMLAAAKRIVPNDRALRQGDWRPRYRGPHGRQLRNRTALVVGYGHIGRWVARICAAMDMTVLATRGSLGEKERQGEVVLYPAEALHQLLPVSDVIILCAPLTESTRGMIGKEELDLLPPDAILVNVGRGELVDQWALYRALAQQTLGVAGLDVWYQYPVDKESRSHTKPAGAPFWNLDNVVLSPHRGGMVEGTPALRTEAMVRLLNRLADGDTDVNRVHIARGY